MKYVGVAARNSIDFVEAVFHALAKGQPVLILKEVGDETRISNIQLYELHTPEYRTGWASLDFTPNNSLDAAQIAFTSGTEGEPKGIVISHRNLADMVERLNSVMRMDSSIKEYIGVPVYHSFGFGRCRAVSTVGGSFYLPSNGFDPLEIKEMLDNHSINAISAVPSLWRILFQNQDIFGDEVNRVKWIEIGSQYMRADEKKNLQALFPKATIVQHYGLTEASRSTFLEVHSESDVHRLESVGRPVGDTEIKINKHGCIAIRGSLVAREKWQAGELTSLLDEGGWLHTTDLGSLDDGYLYYGGRSDDIINCGGIKLNPDHLERKILEAIAEKNGVVCAGIADPLRGEGLLLSIAPALHPRQALITDAAHKILEASNVHIGQALKVQLVDQFPVTPTGKVKRRELASLYLEKTSIRDQTLVEEVSEVSTKESELLSIWKQVLGVSDLSVNDSFADVGGDSLSAIAVIIKMKKKGVDDKICRGILQGKTIKEIVSEQGVSTESETKARKSEAFSSTLHRESVSIKVMRGILVLLVIFAHWSEGIFNSLPDFVSGLKPFLATVLASGTPGFAIMYGVMLGYSLYPVYQKSPDRIFRLLKPILIILGAGIAILASLDILVKIEEQDALSLTDILNSFYSVLTYYFLATLSLPVWFLGLARSRQPIAHLLVCSVILYLLYHVWLHPLTRMPAEGIIEFIKLLAAAKYSYVNMTAGVFLGMAVGIALFEKRMSLQVLSAPFYVLSGVVVSILLSLAMGHQYQWFEWPTSWVPAWRWVFYLIACIFLLRVVDWSLRSPALQGGFVRMMIECVGCVGILAFPMFVLHEIVHPLKVILVNLGIDERLAMVGVLFCFALLSVLMIKKTHRLQFG